MSAGFALGVAGLEDCCQINLRFVAYRLLDLGFEKDVSSILTAVKKALLAGVSCQTVLLSATLNEGTVPRTVAFTAEMILKEDIRGKKTA